ncbi:Rhodanese-like protein [Crinalium epipsammum PCC 9333]|uniref:Rhodanese-like protein n=2 Tax=Crinalium TaxID=241421 RepID=K9W5Y7_9CYAN|nr:Rhodanese-like protein [Crinalium epipsammum PCC 9333]
MSNISENLENAKDKITEGVENVTNKVADSIKGAKDNMPEVTPTPPGMKSQSSVEDLKSRLEWGEPAFTILDVRDRETFNDGHIMGAMAMPVDQLVDRAKSSLEPSRDIYVYGETDEATASAASSLRQAGFECVAELKGGFAAWKAIGGATEGVSESRTPAGADDYNVVSRLQDEASKS